MTSIRLGIGLEPEGARAANKKMKAQVGIANKQNAISNENTLWGFEWQNRGSTKLQQRQGHNHRRRRRHHNHHKCRTGICEQRKL